MMLRNLSNHFGKIAIGAALLAASVYLAMIGVTLAHLEFISGQAPFDMRPFGYGPAEAAELLGGLGIEGRRFYLTRQMPLDTLYPALLALTLSSTLCWLGRGMPNRGLVRLGVTLAVGSALFDYVENLCVVAMIWSWPEVSGPLVYAASVATIAKSVMTTLAIMLVFATAFSGAWLPNGLRQSR